ncbi:hypothetical protein CBL_02909 [Carabus blaptoides fortunei]
MLKDQHLRRPTLTGMFSTDLKQDNDGLRASYNISLLIVKTGKPHTIGEELILPARRIDEMSEDVENCSTDFLKTTEFSLQFDESTLPSNASLLLAYVRFIKDEKICQELLFARKLETETKVKSIFNVLEQYLKGKGIRLNDIESVATDGAPAMVDATAGLLR